MHGRNEEVVISIYTRNMHFGGKVPCMVNGGTRYIEARYIKGLLIVDKRALTGLSEQDQVS